ncbi:MAG: hypothetical protein Q4G58_01325 [bacterium]|nr:hypothetical protein [bacterium]
MKYMDLDITNNAVAETCSIDSGNVRNLRLKWLIKTKYIISGTPIIRGNFVYFSDWGGNIYCANKYSGDLNWKLHLYTAPASLSTNDCTPPYQWCGFAGSGLIINNIWYIASCGGTSGSPLKNGSPAKLYAIDINTARMLFCNTITDSEWGSSLAKLLYFDGLIYLGICGVDQRAKALAASYCVPFKSQTKGMVLAIKASNGMTAWSVTTSTLLPEDLPTATGAGIYSSFTLCPKTGMLYFGTGANYGLPSSSTSNSLVSLNYKSGDYIWHYKTNLSKLPAPDSCNLMDDYYAPGPQVFDYYHDEDRVPAIGIASNDGYYYILNRVTGLLLKKIKLYIGKAPDSTVTGYANAGGTPAILDGKIYIACNNGILGGRPDYKSIQSTSISCIDAASSNLLWLQVQDGFTWNNAGVLCNDTYLVGNINGNLIAYDTTTGDLLSYNKICNASIASSLLADEYSIYVGCGVPKSLGGRPLCGLYCYSVR